jgi:hypothetical protein
MITMLNPAPNLAEAERTQSRYYLAINPCIKKGHIPAVYYTTSRACVACSLQRSHEHPKPKQAEVAEINDPARDVLRAAGW